MRRAAAGVLTVAMLYPTFAFAFPFGGQISQVVPCYNQAIWANVGAPRGGQYIWTPSTKTYQFGPPSFSGQWLLGLAGAPYYCLVSIVPIIVWSGTAITMMGSSGTGGSAGISLVNGQALFNAQPNTGSIGSLINSGANQNGKEPSIGGAGGGTTAQPPVTIGHVVVNEVSTKAAGLAADPGSVLWIELYNGSTGLVQLSGWTLSSASATSTIPDNVSLASGRFLIITSLDVSASLIGVPAGVGVVSVSAPLAGGLRAEGGRLTLRTKGGTLIDALSWGSDTKVLDPSAPSIQQGASISRSSLAEDKNTGTEWTRADASPGH